MAVMILLISLLFPAVTRALARAKQTKCEAQMGGLAKIWTIRYNELDSTFNPRTDDRVYPWLSAMHPDAISNPQLFICPSDKSVGLHGGKPDRPDFQAIDPNDFTETDDNLSNPAAGEHAKRNPDIEQNSYMYEFSDATISWSWQNYILAPGGAGFADMEQIDSNQDGRVTWGEVKVDQLDYGDTFSQGPYNPDEFPIIRCFHHFQDRLVVVRNLDIPGSPSREGSVRVLNAAVSGRVFMSGLKWEYPLDQ